MTILRASTIPQTIFEKLNHTSLVLFFSSGLRGYMAEHTFHPLLRCLEGSWGWDQSSSLALKYKYEELLANWFSWVQYQRQLLEQMTFICKSTSQGHVVLVWCHHADSSTFHNSRWEKGQFCGHCERGKPIKRSSTQCYYPAQKRWKKALLFPLTCGVWM